MTLIAQFGGCFLPEVSGTSFNQMIFQVNHIKQHQQLAPQCHSFIHYFAL